MKAIHLRLKISIVCLFLGLSYSASSAIYEFKPDRVDIDFKTQQNRNHIYAAGYAIFKNSVRVPIYNISILDPISNELTTPQVDCSRGCHFNMTLKPELSNAFKIYNVHGNGYVMVPKAWQRFEASMGVNGDTSITMQSNDGKSNLMVYNSPNCISCGTSNAAPFFPEAAQSYTIETNIKYSGTNTNLKTVRVNAGTVYFDYQLPKQYKTHGVARYQHRSESIYNSMRVTLPSHQKAMASAMLNFYMLEH